MRFEHHTENAAHATTASAVASLGMIDSVREWVHSMAGLVGELGGLAITILTLAWWIRLWWFRNKV